MPDIPLDVSSSADSINKAPQMQRRVKSRCGPTAYLHICVQCSAVNSSYVRFTLVEKTPTGDEVDPSDLPKTWDFVLTLLYKPQPANGDNYSLRISTGASITAALCIPWPPDSKVLELIVEINNFPYHDPSNTLMMKIEPFGQSTITS